MRSGMNGNRRSRWGETDSIVCHELAEDGPFTALRAIMTTDEAGGKLLDARDTICSTLIGRHGGGAAMEGGAGGMLREIGRGRVEG